MPQFVQQAATYSYDKSAPYIDTACNKVPLLQSAVTRLVPYAKPSIQLADQIVDTGLDVASKPVELMKGTALSVSGRVAACQTAIIGVVSKPVELVKGTASSVGGRVAVCKTAIMDVAWKPVELMKNTASSVSGRVEASKTAIIVKVSDARSQASVKLSECKASATQALQKLKSLAVEKSSPVVQVLQQYKVLATDKLGQISSWTSTQLQALAARLHLIELRDMATTKFGQASTQLQALATRLRLIELRDMAFRKGSAWKKSSIEVKDTAFRKGDAVTQNVIAIVEMIPVKAYSVAACVVGKARVDSVLELAAKYAPLKSIFVKKTSEVEIVKKSQ